MDKIELTPPLFGTKRKRGDEICDTNKENEDRPPQKPLVRCVLNYQATRIDMDQENGEPRPKKPLVRCVPKYQTTHSSGLLQGVNHCLLFIIAMCADYFQALIVAESESPPLGNH